jgi:hypothetical protein
MTWIGDMCFFAACKKRSATEIWISFDSRWLRAVLGWPCIGGSPLFGGREEMKGFTALFYLFFMITTTRLTRKYSKYV